MTDATQIYAIAVWAGVAFLYVIALINNSHWFLKLALVASLLMAFHHSCMATSVSIKGDYMNISRKRNGVATINGHSVPDIPLTKPKKADWKHECSLSLDQNEIGVDGGCLAVAIIHAVACGQSLPDAEMMVRQLDIMINTYEYGHRKSVERAVQAAIDLGYVRRSVKVATFEEYKTALALGPVVLGFRHINDGLLNPNDMYFISPYGELYRGENGNLKGHAMVALGHREGWLLGRYSVVKNGAGSRWGHYGEAQIFDADLKKMFKDGTVEAVLVVK